MLLKASLCEETFMTGKAAVLLVVALLVGAVGWPAQAAPHPSLVDVPDDPKLPRVLLIGDSISMEYTIPVRRLLEGRANVHRVPENGGPTLTGLAKIDL